MIRRIISFDSYEATTYDIVEGVAPYRSLPGVKSAEVFTSSGSPRYWIILDVDDEHDETVAARFEADRQSYAAYLSNYSSRALKQVG